MLIPERFLNDLPTINADGFKDYIWDSQNETLRNDLNYSIKSDLDKEAIMNIARSRPEWVKEYEEYQERKGFKPYDLKKDKKGVYMWADKELIEHVQNNPFLFSDADTFCNCIFKS